MDTQELVLQTLQSKLDTAKIETETKINAVDSQVKELNKSVEKIGLELTKKSLVTVSNKPITFANALYNSIVKNDDFQQYKEKRIATFRTKVVGNVTHPNSVTGDDWAFDTLTSPIMELPARPMWIRQILGTFTTNASEFKYRRETGGEDAPNSKLEGAAGTQFDQDFEAATASVSTIFGWEKISQEMLEDVVGLVAFINSRLPKKLLVVEDNKILYGNNTNGELQGITTVASAFAAGAFANSVTSANEANVIRVAMAAVRGGEYVADWTVLHPDDVAKIELLKDDNGYPLSLITSDSTGQKWICGIRILESTAITTGRFLVGDFSMGAALVDRKQIEVEIGENGNDFASYSKTIRVYERIALPIFRTAAFVYGTFSTAIAAIDKAS